MGATAEEAYVRMIDLVTMAEQRLAKATRKIFPGASLPATAASVAEIAPILRGLMSMPAKGGGREAAQRFVFEFRTNPEILAFVNGKEIARYSQQGPVTPDHAIRTKNLPFVAPAPEAGKLDAFKAGRQGRARQVRRRLSRLFRAPQRQADRRARRNSIPSRASCWCRASACSASATRSKDAKIAADLAETTVAVIADAERLGTYECIPEPDIFDIEYWSLEQAKLSSAAEKPLARRIAVVTGGASGIGAATAAALRQGRRRGRGDRPRRLQGEGLRHRLRRHQRRPRCAPPSTRSRRPTAASTSSSPTPAPPGRARSATVDDATLRQSFELNFWAHQSVAQNAVRIMRAQGLGGCLLFNTSKQAVNPGPDFGPYGLPKAATLFLMRQYALDHGADGIRSNAVNADRIRSGLLTDEMIAQRSKARGLSEADYMGGNLLGLEVTAEDVAQCFVSLAKAPKTTGAVLTVDGGNIAAALR